MTKTKEKIPPVVKLNYSKGDLIIKAGDYGISIYEIVSGKVGIFIESQGSETRIAVRGPGMIFGEMAFISGYAGTRSASARALEDCCLEVWHPVALLHDYKNIPGVLNLIAKQALRLITRMNKLMFELSLKQEKLANGQPYDPQQDKRQFYRKKVDIECVFRPVNSPRDLKLQGRINDISKGGLGLAVKTSGLLNHSLVPGDELFISTYIKPDQKLNMTVKIIWIKKQKKDDAISMGTIFTRMEPEDRRRLGFFLLP
jgi:hypothetical protein